MRLLKRLVLLVLAVFIAPALATMAWWEMQDRPTTWRNASWVSSGVLPVVDADRDAAIYVMAARTGGHKGALAVHSWLVVKKPGAAAYERYDKVGWGLPIRQNAYAADARWYSNTPFVVRVVHGAEAERLIPQVEAAIAAYPYAQRGGYRLWPGPNSNTFVASVLRAVPGLKATLPPNATGRDYAPGIFSFDWSAEARDLHATFGGLFGLSAGALSGFEVHLLGLVAGIDIAQRGLKIPAWGTVGFGGTAIAAE